MSEIIDLDAIAPKPAVIKFDGVEITVQPPLLSDYLMLDDIGERLMSAPQSDSALINKITEELTQFFYRVIPELEGKQLHKSQLETLNKVFVNMAKPPAAKEMEANGVTVDSSSKKEK